MVDDESAIRALVARVLGRFGHEVVACADAAAALAAPGPIDLLLVDLVLPDVNGCELAAKLRERWPRLPVILMSGYLPRDDMQLPPPSSFLQKPMGPTDVIAAVNQLLRA